MTQLPEGIGRRLTIWKRGSPMVRDLLDRPQRRERAGVWQGMRVLAAAVLLAAAPASWALGLGDIDLDSALNEKFSARIELFDVQGLQPEEIIVSLASADDFDRVGVERFFFLTDLRFQVAPGSGHILVTSTQPVTEPYLNFLVEVLWPNGRMLKEFTVLLDPPTFSPAAAAPVAAPSVARADDRSAGAVERAPEPAWPATASRGTQVQLGNAAAGPSPLDEGVVGSEYRMTDRNDTLWNIAQRTRPSDRVSVQQNMLAIQRLNPEAFLRGNINLLKAGYSLRLPSEAEALSLGSGEANELVAMQNEDWRALRRGDPVPSRGAAEQVAGAEQPQGSPLRSQVDATPADAAPRSGSTAAEGQLRIVAGAGDGVSSGADSDVSIEAALEEQDRLNREVSQLNEALDREKELASNQIAVKERQIEVRDQQIAELQAELARAREELAQAAAAPQSQNQSASTPDQPWWQSPYVLFGGAGILVLLLVYGMITVRRRRAADDEFYAEDEVEPAVTAPTLTPGRDLRRPAPAAAATAVAGAGAAATDDLTESLADADLGREDAGTTAKAGARSETSDVIGEADIYVAYGRYPQAIGLLLGVLEDDAGRNDVRLKLLELYAETRDRDAFDQHMAELVERCDDEEALLTARELSQQFGDADTDNGDQEDALALDLDEVDAPAALTDDAPARPQADEFELELDEAADDGPTEQPASLGGDLGIDFDPERVDAPESDELPDIQYARDEANDGDDLDLDLDLDSMDPVEEEAFDFADEGDTASTKLDLARAYIDMGDQDGARDILNEVVAEGNADQQKRAQAMLEEL